MKRLNPTEAAILEEQITITYLERKLTHKKQRLAELLQKQQSTEMVDAVCRGDDGSVLFLSDGTLRRTLERAIDHINQEVVSSTEDEVIVIRTPATLVFKFDKNATGSSPITVTRMIDVCARLPVRYETYNTRWLEQEIIAELTPYAPSDKEFEFSVLIYRVMPAVVARKFWRGTYGVLIARELDSVPSEDGTNDYTRELDAGGGERGISCTEVADLDENNEPSPPLSEKEWKRRFAWKSLGKLWYCKRTAELLGKPTTGEF